MMVLHSLDPGAILQHFCWLHQRLQHLDGEKNFESQPSALQPQAALVPSGKSQAPVDGSTTAGSPHYTAKLSFRKSSLLNYSIFIKVFFFLVVKAHDNLPFFFFKKGFCLFLSAPNLSPHVGSSTSVVACGIFLSCGIRDL